MASSGYANAHYGEPNSEFKQWLSNADLADMESRDQLPPAEGRAAFREMIVAATPPMEGVKDTMHKLKTVDGTEIEARVYTQEEKSSTSAAPLAVVYHAGGWTLGTHEVEYSLIRTLVQRLGFVVISIDYRLAPEHPFPVPFEDSYAGFKWAIDNAGMIGADPKSIFVAGSSAGGNLAAAVALRAREDGVKNLRGQILLLPCLCDYRHFPKDKYELQSAEQHADAAVLSGKKMMQYWDWYNAQNSASPLVSPLLSTSLAGAAPAYIQVGGCDPLRDEGIAYAKALETGDVKVKLDIYSGLPHGFTIEVFGFPSAIKAMADLEANVRWLLGLNE
jgi:acetyl esterase/lipase